METLLADLAHRLDSRSLWDASVIPWSCPVPVFGVLATSRVATLGINPSNREFVDSAGRELDGVDRRFHTLRSLQISRWSNVRQEQISLLADCCREYFQRRPYDTWFRKLDFIISGTQTSYYGRSGGACHLDLVPYATAHKWTDLTPNQRRSLLAGAAHDLGRLIRDSPIRVIVLNGRSVVDEFRRLSGADLARTSMDQWTLGRGSNPGVKGTAYMGVVKAIGGVILPREVTALGFNHNVQSSFGVTNTVLAAIREWLAQAAARSATPR